MTASSSISRRSPRTTSSSINVSFITFSGSTGICVVPLTSFFTPLLGFRLTLLETDEDRFECTVKKLAEKIVEYIDSTKRMP